MRDERCAVAVACLISTLYPLATPTRHQIHRAGLFIPRTTRCMSRVSSMPSPSRYVAPDEGAATRPALCRQFSTDTLSRRTASRLATHVQHARSCRRSVNWRTEVQLSSVAGFVYNIAYTKPATEEANVELIGIHPHAYKHGLTSDEIEHAWRNAFEQARRDRADGRVDYLLVGLDQKGRLIELIARCCGKDQYIIFHAITPPTRKFLLEMGLSGR